mgnify:CR=1 FL=1
MTSFLVCLLISLVETIWFYNIVKDDKDNPIEEKMLLWVFIFILAITVTTFIFFVGYMVNLMIGVY